MEKVIINSYEEFEKLVGQQIGVSDYVELSQERIDLFADATLDHQWIHVDTERAKVDSPYHSTIAHGYLTLSMLPYLWNQIIQVNNLKMMINYGMDKMKFGQAVLSGQSIRLVTTLHSLTNLRGVAKAEIKFAIEIEGDAVSGSSASQHWVRQDKADADSFFCKPRQTLPAFSSSETTVKASSWNKGSGSPSTNKASGKVRRE